MQQTVLLLTVVFVISTVSASTMMTGGMKHLDTKDSKLSSILQELGTFSVDHIQKQRQSEALKANKDKVGAAPLTYSLVEVKSAKSQVVAGIMYHLELTIKNSVDSAIEVCDVKVWEKKWENFREVNKFECRPQKQSAQLLGSRHTINKDNEGALDALDFGMKQINAQSNDLFFHVVFKVKNVFRQLVAGFKYIIEFESAPSKCAKSDQKVDVLNLDECEVPKDVKTRQCRVEIWDQPWATPRYKLIGHECS